MNRPKIPADSFVVVHGPSGFVLIVQQAEFDTTLVDKGATTIPLAPIEEIRISPIVAKQLARALVGNIRQYEEIYGEIQEIPNSWISPHTGEKSN